MTLIGDSYIPTCAYRISGCTMPPYEDTGAFAKKIIETKPGQAL